MHGWKRLIHTTQMKFKIKKKMFVLLGCTILFCYFTLFIGSTPSNSKPLLIIFIAGLLAKLRIKPFIYGTAFSMSAYN